jgi:hypothetical protein
MPQQCAFHTDEGPHPRAGEFSKNPLIKAGIRADHTTAASETSRSSVTMPAQEQVQHIRVPKRIPIVPLKDMLCPEGINTGYLCPQYWRSSETFRKTKLPPRGRAKAKNITFANLPVPFGCFFLHCFPLPHPDSHSPCSHVSFQKRHPCHRKVYRLKPQLLYLFWENQRQVQPNEFGKMPGLWQLLSWQLLVFTDRGEQKFPG